jgi:hypothetical protein
MLLSTETVFHWQYATSWIKVVKGIYLKRQSWNWKLNLFIRFKIFCNNKWNIIPVFECKSHVWICNSVLQSLKRSAEWSTHARLPFIHIQVLILTINPLTANIWNLSPLMLTSFFIQTRHVYPLCDNTAMAGDV